MNTMGSTIPNMIIFYTLPIEIAWAFAILVAWIGGELAMRFAGFPRISTYGLVGFILAHAQIGFFPETETGSMLFIANLAFGLILFELGYRINIRWVFKNPWIGISGIVESVATFCVMYAIATLFSIGNLNALILASLAMSTSPAGILRIINEEKSSGQVTERILHLTAINCILAVLFFKIIVALSIFKSSGSLVDATSNGLFVVSVSVAIGAAFGIFIPNMTRMFKERFSDTTVMFALVILLIVAITHGAKLSPLLASLSFGLMIRHQQIVFSPAQRNFGALGEILTVFLFVFVVSSLEWEKIWAGAALGTILILARLVTKTFCITIFSHLSGVSWRKGALAGLGLAPISVFVILVLEQARYLGISFIDEIYALTAMTFIMEILGPVITQRALILAKETHRPKET